MSKIKRLRRSNTGKRSNYRHFVPSLKSGSVGFSFDWSSASRRSSERGGMLKSSGNDISILLHKVRLSGNIAEQIVSSVVRDLPNRQ